MSNGRSPARIRFPDHYRHSFTNATPNTPMPYSAVNISRDGFHATDLDFTDEEENNDALYRSYNSNQTHSIATNVGDDVVRTGEASRLRRRGAVHGRRPQPSFVTLICGAPLPWRFKFKEPGNSEHKQQPSSPQSLMRRYESLKKRPSSSPVLPLEFPSTGCRAILTNRAYASPTHHVYSAQLGVENVAIIDKCYLDKGQKTTVVELLADSWGRLDWQGLACSECGNLIGFRYAPATLDEQGNPLGNHSGLSGYTSKERFAFFPSAVTSSKPYDFKTQQHTSSSYYWRYLEPLTMIVAGPNLRTSSAYALRTQNRGAAISNPQGTQPYQYHHPTSSSQNQLNTPFPPFTSDGEAEAHFLHPNSRSPLSIRSGSPPLFSSDAVHRDSWDEGEREPSLAHVVHEIGPDGSTQRLDGPWATWYPDPALATDDEGRTASDAALSDTISILRMTYNDIAPDTRLSLPSLMESQFPDDVDLLHHSDDVGPAFETGNVDITLDMPQGPHAINVLPAGSEHEQVPSDHHHAFTQQAGSALGSPPVSSQQQPVVLPDVEISNLSSADDSQGYPELERVNDGLFGRPDTVQQGAGIESISEPSNLPSPSRAISPVTIPIAYDSPAMILDVDTSNDMTNEMESAGVMVEVISPPSPPSISDFSSAVAIPSLVNQTVHVASGSPLMSTNRLSELVSGDSATADNPLENSDAITDGSPNAARGFGNSTANDDIFGNEGESLSRTASTQYRQYTPPLPQLSLVAAPSLPSSPSHHSLSPPSPDSDYLLTISDSIQGGLLSEHTSTELQTFSAGCPGENILVPESPGLTAEASEQAALTEIPRAHLEPLTPTEPDILPRSTAQSLTAEERRCSTPLVPQSYAHPSSSSSSPSSLSPPSFSSLSRHVFTSAPVSHPQPLPSSSLISHEDLPAPVPSISRRLSRHASHTPASSLSQGRSSSRRSWRTPRELLESPASVRPADENDVDHSPVRARSRSLSRGSHSITPSDGGYSRELHPSVSVSRRVRGQSRIRRRRLSSSSRRESRLSSPPTSSGPTFHARPPSHLLRHSARPQLTASTTGTQGQLRMGDSLRRLPGLAAGSELTRRGSLPNIDRPRLAGLVRRDSLPVLSMQREPLADLTATFHQREFVPIVPRVLGSDSNTRAQLLSLMDQRPMSSQRHMGERVVFDVSSSRGVEYGPVDRHAQEDNLNLEQENEPINDLEDALTPRPRRHMTMPVFIPPSPPSDSDSELEDNNQDNDRAPFVYGPTFVPWMPWEWCWQGGQQNSSDNRLQIEVRATEIAGESDKED